MNQFGKVKLFEMVLQLLHIALAGFVDVSHGKSTEQM